jgi:release factor glutamine methyltransferase
VIAVDASMASLEVAKINQEKYASLPVMWAQSDWLGGIDLKQIDIIVSNPPYVESDWQHPSITHEPSKALFSGPDGLDDIRAIIKQTQAHHHLDIWFEHGHCQDLMPLLAKPWDIHKHKDLANQTRFSHIHC